MIRQITVPPLDRLDPYLAPRPGADPQLTAEVAGVIADVRVRGDEAVRDQTRRVDGVDLPPERWEVLPATWQEALDRIDLELRDALEAAIERVREYHLRQRETGFQQIGRAHV